MDRAANGPSLRRQPHELICPLQAGAYRERAHDQTADAKTPPIETSLALLEGLHARWAMLLRSFDEADWARTLTHPELGPVTLDELLCIYDWHSRHHVAHITALREREGF
jgi:hypothetical protein